MGLAGKRPILRFVAVFVLVMAVYYVLSETPLITRWLGPAHLRLNAALSSLLLNTFGEETRRVGVSLVSPRLTVDIRRGCDALEPSALLIAGILAFPASWRARLLGIAVGVPIIQAVNLIRIITLYYAGVHAPSVFETFHVEVWQPGFILLVALLWTVWLVWLLRGSGRGRRTAAPAG